MVWGLAFWRFWGACSLWLFGTVEWMVRWISGLGAFGEGLGALVSWLVGLVFLGAVKFMW